MAEPPLLLALDLTGTFAFALNGAITGLEKAKLDIIGMLTLGMVTALGGGILRDVLINALPPATFSSWPYLAVAAGGALIAFFLSRQLRRFTLTILLLDAAGLSLFCVTGATKSLEYGLGPGQAVILGAVTAVGGGTIRDVLVRQVPTVLTSGLYAIPALVGAAIAVTASRTGVYGVPAALGAVPGLLPDPASGHPLQYQRAHRTRGQEQGMSTARGNPEATGNVPPRAGRSGARPRCEPFAQAGHFRVQVRGRQSLPLPGAKARTAIWPSPTSLAHRPGLAPSRWRHAATSPDRDEPVTARMRKGSLVTACSGGPGSWVWRRALTAIMRPGGPAASRRWRTRWRRTGTSRRSRARAGGCGRSGGRW